MLGLIKALGVLKLAAVTTLLTTVVAAAAFQPSLPSQAAQGQARAAAGATNGQTGGQAQTGEAMKATENAQQPDLAAVVNRLDQNRDRLLANLAKVIARLQASNANSAAVAALQKVSDRIANGTVGLNRAAQVVAAHGAANVSLPAPASNRPTPDNHPGRP